MDWRGKLIYCQNRYLFTLAMRQFERDLFEWIRQAQRREGWVTKVALSVATGSAMKVLRQTEDLSVAGLTGEKYTFSRSESATNQSEKLESFTLEQLK